MARPLFLENHLGIVETRGMKAPLEPIPIIIPQIRYICTSELTCDIERNPMPKSRPLTVSRGRGPHLSVNRPAKMAITPPTNIIMEKAPDRAPLSQLNSSVSGLKNMPKQ